MSPGIVSAWERRVRRKKKQINDRKLFDFKRLQILVSTIIVLRSADVITANDAGSFWESNRCASVPYVTATCFVVVLPYANNS